MPTLPPDALRAALLESIGPYRHPRLDPAPLREALLAMPPDERAALLLERMRTYVDGPEYAYGNDFPAACFAIDVTDDRPVAAFSFGLIHRRLTARRRRVSGDSLEGEDFAYYSALLRAAGPSRAAHVTALLTWHCDDASVVAAVLDTLTRFADPDGAEALRWVARFDKGNRARAVALLVALGDGALEVVESLAGSDEAAAREVAFRALAAMPPGEAARRVAARVRKRVKGVPAAVRDAIVAMAAAAPDGPPQAPAPPMELVPKRVPPRLPPYPDTSRVGGELRALDAAADAVSDARRAALDAALDAHDPAAIDAAADAIGAPAMALALRWHRTQRAGDSYGAADRVARVAARVPVTAETAAAAVPRLITESGLAHRAVAALLERFAEHLLAPAVVGLTSEAIPFNRIAAIEALARHHPRAALRLFLDALGDQLCWGEASKALEAIGADALEGCAALLTGRDLPTAHGAARHLTRVADPAALAAIEYALPRAKPGVHDELVRALAATLRAPAHAHR